MKMAYIKATWDPVYIWLVMELVEKTVSTLIERGDNGNSTSCMLEHICRSEEVRKSGGVDP